MEIGQRLKQLRLAKDLSQGDIERKSGLIRAYLSRVECGHTKPSISTLEKWAKALGVELYQIFFTGRSKLEVVKVPDFLSLSRQQRRLLKILAEFSPGRRRLVMSLVHELRSRWPQGVD